MKRVLILAALSALGMACGDDDGGDKPGPTDAGPDAKADTGTLDGSAGGVKVTNVGTACTQASQCTGPSATCATATPIGSPFPGGYCSATCSASSECGTNGACPLGELIALAPNNPQVAGLSGQCWEKCTTLGASCRDGYVCTTLGIAFGVNMPLPQLMLPICLPGSAGDGGVHDASVTDASGIDASG